MITSGAASLPGEAGGPFGPDLPDLDRLRTALRRVELPLPPPRSVRQAAHRVADLINSARFREARALTEQFRRAPADPADRFLLLRTSLRGALAQADGEQIERDAADLLAVLVSSGHREQAAATAAVLRERAGAGRHPIPEQSPYAGQPLDPEQPLTAERPPASPEMLEVTRVLERSALERSALPDRSAPHGANGDPRQLVAALRSALAALPVVRDRLLVDPERELRLHLAQTLELLGDDAGATSAALDVLEAVDQEEAGTDAGIGDPTRAATAAHAVLARTLGPERPLLAAHHALEALDALRETDDPPLRIDLITCLLQALMAAGATAQATLTAGRLLFLQRTLDQDVLRISPLLAVTAQRLQAERIDAARVPLKQARSIARARRDHRSLLEVSRLAASLHERRGEHADSLRELQSLAGEARWLANDLDTTTAAQDTLIRTELEANALVMRRALDLGRMVVVREAVEAIERRTRAVGRRSHLPAELLWDLRVDARVGLLIAVGAALLQGEPGAEEPGAAKAGTGDVEGAAEVEYELRHRDAAEAVDEAPPGHDARAAYWRTYLEDRHAHLLAERGKHAPAAQVVELRSRALEAAVRAREGWSQLGQGEDVDRLDALLATLRTAREADDRRRS